MKDTNYSLAHLLSFSKLPRPKPRRGRSPSAGLWLVFGGDYYRGFSAAVGVRAGIGLITPII
jgi:hypothetical protein